MYHFCTYFDKHYLQRAMALYGSLRSAGREFRLWALCMDAASYQAIREPRLPGIEPVALDDLEGANAALLDAKTGRSRAEYFFTCTPSLPLYVLERWPEVDLVTYLDADLFFYSDPMPLFAEVGDASIAIVPHRFSRMNRGRRRFGIYNVGWVSFRRDEEGLRCLRWWRDRCLEWCYDRVEEHRYADQKYLDDWPERFGGVHVLEHKGANLAPWNIANYRICGEEGGVTVDGEPLVFFHFQGFEQIRPWLYKSNFGLYHTRPSYEVRRKVIEPYVRALRGSTPAAVLQRGIRESERRYRFLLRGGRGLARLALGLATQEYVLVVNERVL